MTVARWREGAKVAFVDRSGRTAGSVADPSTALLKAALTVESTDVVLNINCGLGEVGIAAAELVSAGRVVLTSAYLPEVRIASQNLRARGLANAEVVHSVGTSHVSLERPEGARSGLEPDLGAGVDVVAARLPRGRLPSLQCLWDAFQALRPGGSFYLAGENDDGIRPALDRVEALFGAVEVLDYRKGARVAVATRPATPPPLPEEFADPLLDHRTFHRFEVVVRGQSHLVCSRPGVFSWDGLDPGTRALAEALDLRDGEQILDLGCGNGILGVVAAKQCPRGRVYLIDADADAVDSASATVAANGLVNAVVLPSDSIEAVAGERFDAVITNPPFHLARGADTEVARRFLRDAARVLRRGGRLLLVANRFLPYEDTLREAYRTVTTVFRDNRYKVLRAADPVAEPSYPRQRPGLARGQTWRPSRRR